MEQIEQKKEDTRVLARKVARVLTASEIQQVSGAGTKAMEATATGPCGEPDACDAGD